MCGITISHRDTLFLIMTKLCVKEKNTSVAAAGRNAIKTSLIDFFINYDGVRDNNEFGELRHRSWRTNLTNIHAFRHTAT